MHISKTQQISTLAHIHEICIWIGSSSKNKTNTYKRHTEIHNTTPTNDVDCGDGDDDGDLRTNRRTPLTHSFNRCLSFSLAHGSEWVSHMRVNICCVCVCVCAIGLSLLCMHIYIHHYKLCIRKVFRTLSLSIRWRWRRGERTRCTANNKWQNMDQAEEQKKERCNNIIWLRALCMCVWVWVRVRVRVTIMEPKHFLMMLLLLVPLLLCLISCRFWKRRHACVQMYVCEN